MTHAITTTDRRAPVASEWNDWRWQTRNRLRSAAEVLRAVGLEGRVELPEEVLLARFPVGVSPYYVSRIRRGDPNDPILQQIVPSTREAEARSSEQSDPFREDERSPVPGIVHRYPDRALVLPTNFCATLCRHCFRKRSWAEGFYFLDRAALARAVEYVRRTPSIRDVLITGGDPLHLATETLAALVADLRSIERLDVVRIASRMPVTLPQRIDEAWIRALAPHRPLWFITHFNCVEEVSAESVAALRRLLDAGITVQNQTVLLREVNDTPEAQLELARAMIRVGVRPYYLHLADPVVGAGHFRTSIERGIEIVREMQGKISGFAIPRLVLDLPGGRGKVPIAPDFRISRDADAWIFESPLDGGEVRVEDVRD